MESVDFIEQLIFRMQIVDNIDDFIRYYYSELLEIYHRFCLKSEKENNKNNKYKINVITEIFDSFADFDEDKDAERHYEHGITKMTYYRWSHGELQNGFPQKYIKALKELPILDESKDDNEFKKFCRAKQKYNSEKIVSVFNEKLQNLPILAIDTFISINFANIIKRQIALDKDAKIYTNEKDFRERYFKDEEQGGKIVISTKTLYRWRKDDKKNYLNKKFIKYFKKMPALKIVFKEYFKNTFQDKSMANFSNIFVAYKLYKSRMYPYMYQFLVGLKDFKHVSDKDYLKIVEKKFKNILEDEQGGYTAPDNLYSLDLEFLNICRILGDSRLEYLVNFMINYIEGIADISKKTDIEYKRILEEALLYQYISFMQYQKENFPELEYPEIYSGNLYGYRDDEEDNDSEFTKKLVEFYKDYLM